MFVILVKLPHTAAPPVHPAMLQLTPFAAGSLVTAAEESWLPPVTTLTVGGVTVTEIGSAVGSCPQPLATARPRRPTAVRPLLVACRIRRATRCHSAAPCCRA